MAAFPFTRLDRYLISQLLRTILFAVLLFTVVWLAPETLFKLVQYVFSGKISIIEALTLFLYHIPGILQQTIPMAVFVASVFTFRRLSQHMEMVSIYNAGISVRRVLMPLILCGLVCVLGHFAVQEWLTPWVDPKLQKMLALSGIKEAQESNFVFVERSKLSRNTLDKFFLIGRVDPHQLRDFIILYYNTQQKAGSEDTNQIIRILRAPEGRWNPKQKAWQLFNGIDYELDEDGVYRETRKFQEQWVNTSPYAFDLLEFSTKNPKSMAFSDLWSYLNLLKVSDQSQDIGFFTVRFHQKLAIPFTSLFFILLGLFMGNDPPRSTGLLTLTAAALVLFVFAILIPFSTNLGAMELIPPVLAAWLPLGGAALVSLGILQWRKAVFGS